MRAWLVAVMLLLLQACGTTTNISYFPDQRGPFVCRITDAPSQLWPDSQEFETIPLSNWPKFFALRKPATNEIVVLANDVKVKQATANRIYTEKFGQRKTVAVKILMVVGLDGASLQPLKKELLQRFPGANISESIPVELVVDLYSMWLGSEYVRAPCDGIGLDNIPFEVTLPQLDGDRFIASPLDSLQFAGRVMYRDARSGWRFHRSFSLKRSEFSVLPE